MDMQMNPAYPDWLTPVAWAFVALAVVSAVMIAFDIYGRGHRRRTAASELVWIASALYLGPFALVVYARHSARAAAVAAQTEDVGSEEPVTVAGLPGGGASAVAHLIGVPLVLASGLTIAGIDLWVMIIVIGVLAMVLLFLYERAASRTAPAGGLTVGASAAAAVLTVLAFDIGMGGWMLLLHFNEFMPPATDAAFWMLMQLGIVLGLITGYPVVAWLERRRRTVVPA